MNSPFVNQVACTQAEFAVIGTCRGYGSGIMSWHADEFSAKATERNFIKLGGSVRVEPCPGGLMPQAMADEVKDLVLNRSRNS